MYVLGLCGDGESITFHERSDRNHYKAVVIVCKCQLTPIVEHIVAVIYGFNF